MKSWFEQMVMVNYYCTVNYTTGIKSFLINHVIFSCKFSIMAPYS